MSGTGLPEGWCNTLLGEISQKLVDGSHNPPKKKADGFPMLSAINIDGNQISYEPCRLITEEEFDAEHKRTQVQVGDVLLTIVGAIGRVAVVPENHRPFTLQRSVAVIAPVQIDSKYLMYHLESPSVAKYFKENARGTAQKGVYLKTLSQLPLLIPPVNEQHRIVAKIEELFSELDKGIESLKTAREQLKVYRQALLKHAFEGKLTEQWRKDNADKLETADQLLERIKLERETRYQQQLEEWKAAVKQWEADGKEGKRPSKPKMPKNLGEFTQGDLADFSALPRGWQWVKFDKICEHDQYAIKAGPFGSALKKEHYSETGYKVYGQEQVISGDPYYGDYYVPEKKYQELTTCKIKPQDILISLVGTIGKVLVLPDDCAKGIINPRLIKVSANTEYYLPEFFKYYFESMYLKSLYKLQTHGATMDVLNLGIIQSLPFPFCSVDEQKEIVNELESKLSVIDDTENIIKAQLLKSEALRQSILKKAFSGQLVPQDPNDEPASVLLERIAKEKEQAAAEAKKTKAAKKKPKTTRKVTRKANQ